MDFKAFWGFQCGFEVVLRLKEVDLEGLGSG
jgi:hypothetical protein